MYKFVVNLWKMEIGEHNLPKLRFTLTYFVKHLENYLTLCDERQVQLYNLS